MHTRTENGCLAYSSTGKELIDFFFKVGASRADIPGIKRLFNTAFKADPLKATATMLWVRDIRHGGAGERQVFRELLKELINLDIDKSYASKVISLIPKIGRWDDLFVVYGTQREQLALDMIKYALRKEDVLCAKWMDRSDKKLQKALGLNEAGLRKLLSSIRKQQIPEAKMCANEWDQIEYGKLPSVCGARNAKAFRRHDEERYQAFLDSKETKVNAKALYPHDVYRMKAERDAAQKYWDNLPDLGLKASILPVVDVSGSMYCQASGSIQCVDIAISLGTYLAQKIQGPFNGNMITFDSNPELVTLPNKSISELFEYVRRLNWGGSTNMQATYRLILQKAKQLNVRQDQMPEYLVVLSDMQFDENSRYTREKGTLLDDMKAEFATAGYEMPAIIWWCLRSSNGFPCSSFEENMALVSGFSPELMKKVLSCQSFTPIDIMESCIEPFIKMLK